MRRAEDNIKFENLLTALSDKFKTKSEENIVAKRLRKGKKAKVKVKENSKFFCEDNKPYVFDGTSELKRVLKLIDLIALGVGSTLGLGVYVLAGQIGYNVAGPGVIISFLISGITSLFAASCYAEFASRVPKSGSAYTYSYVTVGEFIAFTIGWNMVLEYAIGTASLARGLSSYFDSIFGGKVAEALSLFMPLDVPFLANYPDFFSFGLVVVLTGLLALGAKESSFFNIICTTVNFLTIFLIICAGSYYADVRNWFIPREKIPDNFGTGGFFPFGFSGVMKGAAKCFFGFVGFDGIATTAEEAVNPKRNIPLSIIVSLLIVMLAYFGIAIVLTLMVPYFELSPTAPFPLAFERFDLVLMKHAVSTGALFALTTALLGAMFPLPRILYSMGSDGVIFRSMSKVNAFTKTPLLSTVISGSVAALMALLFDLNQLVDMMSIGTLLAYTIVAACVIILRYQDEQMDNPEWTKLTILYQLYNGNSYRQPNILTFRITKICILIFGVVSLVWCTITLYFDLTSSVGIAISSIAALTSLIILIIIALQPVSGVKLNYRVPLVPFIPSISILINVYLMFQLDLQTWIRLIVWMTLGYIVYFGYGISHSTLSHRYRKDPTEQGPEAEAEAGEVKATRRQAISLL